MAKPLEEKKYIALLKTVGWSLEKASIDYNLIDENGCYICSIKIEHGKSKKREVASSSIRRTKKEFNERGWSWPPNKKSKKT